MIKSLLQLLFFRVVVKAAAIAFAAVGQKENGHKYAEYFHRCCADQRDDAEFLRIKRYKITDEEDQ